jgi:hypothetical protein
MAKSGVFRNPFSASLLMGILSKFVDRQEVGVFKMLSHSTVSEGKSDCWQSSDAGLSYVGAGVFFCSSEVFFSGPRCALRNARMGGWERNFPPMLAAQKEGAVEKSKNC